jgi:hypothetical protein
MHETCEGCRAWEVTSRQRCFLGYPQDCLEGIRAQEFLVPLNWCPKPTTVRELSAAVDLQAKHLVKEEELWEAMKVILKYEG